MNKSFSFWVVLIGICLACDTPAADADKDRDGMQGAWTIASAQEGGEEQTDEKSQKMSIQIKDNVFSFKFEGQPKSLNLKLKLDSTQKPKAIDLIATSPEGQVAKGIYELQGDELKVCWSRNGKARPDRFATKPGDDRIFLTLKRVKPKEK